MRKIISIFILTILISSCNEKMENQNQYDIIESAAEMLPITQRSPTKPLSKINDSKKETVIKKKIIKDGRLGLQVSDLEKTKLRIDSIIKIHGGYFANEKFNNSDWESSYNLKVRIPSNNFEIFTSDIETGEGELNYKEMNARDVTDTFIDLESRLENKRSYLLRYKDILKQAKSIKEILAIEEKIRALEEEINSATGRLKYLRDQVNYSTLDLTISKKKEIKNTPVNGGKFSERFIQSISKGWFGLVDFLLLLVKTWPFWIFLPVILYFWRKYKKKKVKN